MENDGRWLRWLTIAGLVLMLAGALDPLEGSPAIVVGAALVAGVAWRTGAALRPLALLAFVLVAAGVGALFGMSALGGVGGSSGRSIWWLLLAAPYPVGWLLGLMAAVGMLRRRSMPVATS